MTDLQTYRDNVRPLHPSPLTGPAAPPAARVPAQTVEAVVQTVPTVETAEPPAPIAEPAARPRVDPSGEWWIVETIVQPGEAPSEPAEPDAFVGQVYSERVSLGDPWAGVPVIGCTVTALFGGVLAMTHPGFVWLAIVPAIGTLVYDHLRSWS